MARTPTRKGLTDDWQSSESEPESNSSVPRPVASLVHPNLVKISRKVYPAHQMCWIFDAVVPASQWKRGTIYTDEDPWAEYGPSPWPDLTEADERKLPQKPYYPRLYEWVGFV